MKIVVLAILMAGTLLSCKKKTSESECGNMICTEQFVSLYIKFVDNKGLGTEVKDFTVVNQRTGDKKYPTITGYLTVERGTYIFADDGNTKSLSEEGDDLKITATSVATNQTKSVVINVKGGKCACHISKVSGPDQLAFD
ncbi:hypothetical protein ABDJ41_09670 [Pedobacter sp. ASV1-7]|uniref:hypothetical protein n=1 Tax=Pedobacter sp. ASV1-7 TaxID=3145237 RepID=UPI0032E8D58E